MAKKFVTVSDLTGNPVDDDAEVVTIAVLEHPTLEHPVQLDASLAEVKDLEDSAKDFVLLELISNGGDQRERLVLELADFEKVIKSGDPQDILDAAEPYNVGPPQPTRLEQDQPRRRGRPPGSRNTAAAATTPKTEKVDYKSPENFGLVHRGRITEEEKAMVQADLDQANANRRREGQPEIELSDAKTVEKYDLYKLAEKAGVVPR